MRYAIEMKNGAVLVKAVGINWFPGDGDSELRRLLGDLYGSGVRSVVLDGRTVRNLAPGLRVEIEEWARRFAEAGGGLALVGTGDGSFAEVVLHDIAVRIFPSAREAVRNLGLQLGARRTGRVVPALARVA